MGISSISQNEGIPFIVILKNSSYVFAFVSGMHWLGFDPQSVTILFTLMLTDIITALARVWVNEGPRNIRSSVFKRGITAKFLLTAGLFSIALTSHGMGFDAKQLAQGAVTVLMLGELYSILGNVHSARTGKPKVEFDAVAVLLSKVRDLLDKAISP
jgi:Bacteriophage holin family